MTLIFLKSKVNKHLIDPYSLPVHPYIHIPSSLLCMYSYLPTPPLGQDMTQGQFLSEV